jgi:hypothetical protein
MPHPTEEEIEEAVARGVQRAVVETAGAAAGAYVIGGCMLVILKAIGWALLVGAVVLFSSCHR